MSEQNVKESEQRQLNLQLENINYTAEEILENKLNAKKRKSSMVAARRAVVNQEGQSTLFRQEQWHELQARFPAVEQEDPELARNLHSLTTRYSLTLQQLSKARTGLKKKLKSLSDWIEVQEKAADMNEDEKSFLYLVSHIIKRHQKSAYLFDSVTNYSEWDYVVKLYVNNLRTKWGDTVFKLANEDGTVDLKIDMRVILDKAIQMHKVEYDVCSGEFSKYDPGNLKYQSNRCKVIIEGKNINNQLVCHGIDICNIPVLQICGSELHMLEVSLVAPGLYVSNKRYSFSLVNTWENFEILPELVENLLKFKNECVKVGDLLEDHLITIEYK
ncbi:MAG: hypothetical protein EXX96DRAFT_538243 [Benjaminiella poitrasii]|nr:MAG: hypothetical protein EXX96DRAFT_538243 [Benjaminiella poitrasii]